MDAIQVSEASMASMFRRAADAIVNESSLKREVDTLTMETQINTRTIETLSAEKGKLNDYVSELQRQLTDAKYEIQGHVRDKADLSAAVDKHKDDNETLTTLLNETEQARDRAIQEAKEYEANWTRTENQLIEAQAKLSQITNALGLPKPTPIEDKPAPGVAAPATFHESTNGGYEADGSQGLAMEDNPPEPWRSGDATTPDVSTPSWVSSLPQSDTPKPVESLHPVPPHADQSRNAWPDWGMNE